MNSKLIGVATLALVAACDPVAAPAPPYRPADAGTVDHAMCLLGFTAIPLQAVATGHHLVQARINKVRGQFVLDTGANVTVIDTAQAPVFGIDPAENGVAGVFAMGAQVRGPPGMQARMARIDSFEIGPVGVRQNRVVIASIGQLTSPIARLGGTTVAGIIGQDVLTEHRAIIDVARPMLYLMMPDRAPAPVAASICGARATAQR